MNEQLRVLDLFSGIGGFALGLRRAGGFKTVAYCEIDPYCQAVLRARMSDGSLDTAPICTDITKLDGKSWGGRVDLICGGFPCQDISNAGNGAGIAEGTRSGLWSEIVRLVRETGPRLLLVENVAALLAGGMGRVLGDLADIGFHAVWRVLPACSFGAPHCRERVWIVGYSKRLDYPRRFNCGIPHQTWAEARLGELVRISSPAFRDEAISSLGGMDDGLPDRVDRLRTIGNSVVPQVVEWIGRQIMKVESGVRT